MKRNLIIVIVILGTVLISLGAYKVYKHFNTKIYSYVINPTLEDIKNIGEDNVDYIVYSHFGELVEDPVIYKGDKALEKYKWLASIEIDEETDIDVLDDSSSYTVYTTDGKSYTIDFNGGYLSYNGKNYIIK